MSTNDLTAGPELDAAVAKAVGITDGRVEGDAFYRWTPPNHNGYTDHFEWSPSTDLNAAFEAADACRLFEANTAVDGGWLTLAGVGDAEQNPQKQWGFMQFGYNIQRCWWLFPNGSGGLTGIAQPTPALAICRAILALHGDK